jgi:hypothetical protein
MSGIVLDAHFIGKVRLLSLGRGTLTASASSSGRLNRAVGAGIFWLIYDLSFSSSLLGMVCANGCCVVLLFAAVKMLFGETLLIVEEKKVWWGARGFY